MCAGCATVTLWPPGSWHGAQGTASPGRAAVPPSPPLRSGPATAPGPCGWDAPRVLIPGGMEASGWRWEEKCRSNAPAGRVGLGGGWRCSERPLRGWHGAGTALARRWHGAGTGQEQRRCAKEENGGDGQSRAALGVTAAAHTGKGTAASMGWHQARPFPRRLSRRVPCLSLRCRPGSRSLPLAAPPSSLSALSLFIARGCF